MGQYVKVVKTGDVGDGEAVAVAVGDLELAIFQVAGVFYALEDRCTHEDAPLSEGWVEGGEVECPWHAARFDLATGKVLCAPACDDVRVFPVRVVGDDVEVEI